MVNLPVKQFKLGVTTTKSKRILMLYLRNRERDIFSVDFLKCDKRFNCKKLILDVEPMENVNQ